MSYILEALKKSEAERRQGKVPDLGQSVQMVYRPGKKPVAAVVWIGLALALNAVVLGVVFWPELSSAWTPSDQPASLAAKERSANAPAGQKQSAGDQAAQVSLAAGEPDSAAPAETNVVPEPPAPDYGQPTIIAPRAAGRGSSLAATPPPGRVPHLVELPLSFQKSVPDLMFNSHIVSSNPAASSVMVNNQYLRVGDRLGSLWLESIGEDAVVFRKGDQRFRVGAQRNWVSPD